MAIRTRPNHSPHAPALGGLGKARRRSTGHRCHGQLTTPLTCSALTFTLACSAEPHTQVMRRERASFRRDTALRRTRLVAGGCPELAVTCSRLWFWDGPQRTLDWCSQDPAVSPSSFGCHLP